MTQSLNVADFFVCVESSWRVCVRAAPSPRVLDSRGICESFRRPPRRTCWVRRNRPAVEMI